jgi:hypothetical protein
MPTSISQVKISRGMQALAIAAILPLLALSCSSNESGNQGGSAGASGAAGGASSGTAGTSGGAGGGAAGAGGTSGGTSGAAGTGGAGNAGTAGATAGTGGAAGSSGASGTGGTVTTDGGGTDAPSACMAPTATSPVISDFAGTTATANQVNGLAAETWVVTPSGMATVAAGEMHGTTTMGTFASASVVLAKGMCANMSKYTGIKFKVRSPSNTMLVFGIQTPETMTDFSNFNKVFAVSATATDVTIPFIDLKSTFGAGSMLPATYKVGEHVRAIAIGIVGATVPTQTEKLDIYLSAVSFY